MTIADPLATLQARVQELEGRLSRCERAASRGDVSLLRALLHNWRSVDEVTMTSPAGMAEQLLRLCDAVDIVQGRGDEIFALDEMLAKAMGAAPRIKRGASEGFGGPGV